MKKIYAFLYLLFLNTAIYAQYISSTVEQVSSSTLAPGSQDNPIIRIKIDVGPMLIDLYGLFINSTGSTNPTADIDTVKVFYTGSNNIFSTSTLYSGGTFPLSYGPNYFWVTYNLSSAATICDTLDAQCHTVYVSGGTQTPLVIDPVGYAVIGNCTTGILSSDFSNPQIVLYPNPATETLTISFPENHTFISPDQKTQIQLISSIGVLLKEFSFSQSTEINLADLSRGLYFIHLKSSGCKDIKFIKQ